MKDATISVDDELLTDGESLSFAVGELLRRKGFTLSLAESCTGGMVAKLITDVPGSSDYFLAGAVTYGNAAKIRLLGVCPQLLQEHGAVSAETAMAMACGMRQNSGSDVALAITGIAGPGGGSELKPVGTVFIALATPDDCQVKRYLFSGNRGQIRKIASFTALDWLRRQLMPL